MKKKSKPNRRTPHRSPVTGHQSHATTTIIALTLERQELRDSLIALLALYDKVSGLAPEAIRGEGWTVADMKRLQEIRALVSRGS